MIRSELIKLISEKHNLDAARSQAALNAIIGAVRSSLAKGGRVELRGFGRFEMRDREPGKGRNPRTGEIVDLPPRQMLHFRCGKELARRLNEET